MRRCTKCKRHLSPARDYCPDPWCPGGKDDVEYVEDKSVLEFTCPLCGGEVSYIGAVPAALECSTRGCPNFKLR